MKADQEIDQVFPLRVLQPWERRFLLESARGERQVDISRRLQYQVKNYTADVYATFGTTHKLAAVIRALQANIFSFNDVLHDYNWEQRRGRLTEEEYSVLEARTLHPEDNNAELGNRLQLAEQTVKNHLGNITNILGARNTTHAVIIFLAANTLGENVISLREPPITAQMAVSPFIGDNARVAKILPGLMPK